ncbi:helix-turn-helix transcriptional regulator [Hasllibacter sp. MH4015]|uniref:helix-turn-helix transcriptional regulator n=1 Tax=Hasllibacter sp. MH4015 TaxID=2854029 RepID=UPI001CD79492|nr:helix-turn-helix transcriptional regulator [Hasllibacter sp. MH4015]
MAQNTRSDLTGSRIRERRLARGLKQGALAEAVGVSPSYLNLIEHNHRKIGGKLLLALAEALGVAPSVLSEGATAAVSETLDAAARAEGGARAETDRIDELAARFPGWTNLIAAQERRAQDLEAQVEALRDRLGHDPDLAEAMHEVLSSVAAIRSTADILVRESDLDPAWRGRFHRNLHEEAERLSVQATGLLATFETPGQAKGEGAPDETVEAMFEAADFHFPELEAKGALAIAGVLDRTAGMDRSAARALGEVRLTRYAEDAARLPLEDFARAARQADYDPAALVARGGGDVALILRRLASLPRAGGVPERGLVICDASGAVTMRRRLAGFQIPRVVPGCPLWPLYRALGRPGQAEATTLETPRGARFRAWAVAQPVGQVGFGAAPLMEATMLVMPQGAGEPGPAPIAIGPGCGTCPRTDCAARR